VGIFSTAIQVYLCRNLRFYFPNHSACVYKNIILHRSSCCNMREALFIKKNKDRWVKNQQMPPRPDEMAKEFTQLVDDLAYAKTFYPSGKVTKYINTEASKIYLSIYKNRKEESNRSPHSGKRPAACIRKHHGVILFTL
jgi:hypothetical protein